MAIEWIKNRLVEPSTWVAVGVALVGIGALSNSNFKVLLLYY